MKKLRLRYAIAFFILLVVEVLIALFVNDDFVRPYVGDMLVVIVIYCFVRIIIPQRCKLLPIWIFVFAAGVELLQYFDIVKVLGLEKIEFFRVLIGTVCDIKDIVCYAIGCGVLFVYEVLQNR